MAEATQKNRSRMRMFLRIEGSVDRSLSCSRAKIAGLIVFWEYVRLRGFCLAEPGTFVAMRRNEDILLGERVIYEEY